MKKWKQDREFLVYVREEMKIALYRLCRFYGEKIKTEKFDFD
jgi:hypothetical protein